VKTDFVQTSIESILEDLVKLRAQAPLRVPYELMETLLNFENRHHFNTTYRKDWKEQTQATCGGSYDGGHKLG
jgi:hypothetical protein